MKKPIKKEETKLKLVTSPTNPTMQFVIASEMADDEAIEKELAGNVLQHFVYSFSQDGKDITGLSVAGVNETVRRLSKNPKSGVKIRIAPTSLTITRDVSYGGEKGVEVSVYAENLITGEGAFGVKFEPYQKSGRNGKYENTFAIEKALSKAERNAKRKLIPEKVVAEMIKTLTGKGDNAVKNLMPVVNTNEDKTKAKAKLDTCATIDDLRKVFAGLPKSLQTDKEILDFALIIKENIKNENLLQNRAGK